MGKFNLVEHYIYYYGKELLGRNGVVTKEPEMQYMNQELPDVQAGFRKGRGSRAQIANIRWIREKARES